MNESSEFDDAAVAVGHIAAEALAIVEKMQEIDRDSTMRRLMSQQICQNQTETIELIRAAEDHILVLKSFILKQARAATASRN